MAMICPLILNALKENSRFKAEFSGCDLLSTSVKLTFSEYPLSSVFDVVLWNKGAMGIRVTR
jgi:hypothetical protein